MNNFKCENNSGELNSLYLNSVAEPSEEEISIIQDIVSRNPEYISQAALIAIVKVELPLCLEKDISMVVNNCIKKKQALAVQQGSTSPFRLTEASVFGNMNNNAYALMEQNSKWSDEETTMLLHFLSKVDGRKNWSACSRYVGTKTSAQCKSKFNNMRAQELPKNYR